MAKTRTRKAQEGKGKAPEVEAVERVKGKKRSVRNASKRSRVSTTAVKGPLAPSKPKSQAEKKRLSLSTGMRVLKQNLGKVEVDASALRRRNNNQVQNGGQGEPVVKVTRSGRNVAPVDRIPAEPSAPRRDSKQNSNPRSRRNVKEKEGEENKGGRSEPSVLDEKKGAQKKKTPKASEKAVERSYGRGQRRKSEVEKVKEAKLKPKKVK